MLRLERLKCEHLEKPYGIENQKPTFSWVIASNQKNIVQTACQVEVKKEDGIIWSSEKKQTDQSAAFVYEGPKLEPLTMYWWKATVWDNHGEEASAESEFMTSRFQMPWHASWAEPEQEAAYGEKGDFTDVAATMGVSQRIRGLDEYEGFQPVQYLRIPFSAVKKPKRVLVCATAHGIYELSVNGKRPDTRLFAPEISPYQKILQYQIYDVTALVREGRNVISVKLADGWWSGRVGSIGNACQYGDKTAFLLEGQLEYEDGSKEYVLSDDAVSSTGPLLIADLFVGEKYDAGKELIGWEDPDYDDSEWKPVRKQEFPMENLIPQQGEPVRVIKSFLPEKIFTAPNGDMIIDLGQNIAGFMSFTVEAKAGTVLRLEHAEVLDKEGNFFKNIMGHNKDQMDVYIARDGKQQYQPTFTYHGFRYVRVSGWPGELTAEDFTAHVVSTDVEDIGSFETSDPKLNRLQKNIWWSQAANTVAIPTDCPQREKAGWTGDVTVYAPTMCFLRNEEVFLAKWLRYCRAEQQEGGEIPTVVPFLESYREMNLFYGTDTSCGWGDVIVAVPWYVYRAYGNRKVLEENYEAMKKWMRYVQRCAETEMPEGYDDFDQDRKERQKYLWNTGFHYGDWLVPSMVLNTTDDMAMINTAYSTKDIVAPAYYAFSTRLMTQIADVLGRMEDARYYEELNIKIRKAFSEEYIDENGHITSDIQGIYVLALKNNLVTEVQKPKVLNRLLEKIAENHGCLDTGFLSVSFLMDVLTENGCEKTAYELLYQKKCPSWLYEVEKGATTIWESWGATSEDGEIGKYSYNHYAYGCVGDWMYRRLAGLNAEEAGYHKIRIEPLYDCGLEYVKGGLKTTYGYLESAWKKTEEGVSLTVTIPANTTASVRLPDGRKAEVGSGTWEWYTERRINHI